MKNKEWHLTESTEFMHACGTANLPLHGDVLIDGYGERWIFTINGGFYLKKEDGTPHNYIIDSSWNELASWYNESIQNNIDRANSAGLT